MEDFKLIVEGNLKEQDLHQEKSPAQAVEVLCGEGKTSSSVYCGEACLLGRSAKKGHRNKNRIPYFVFYNTLTFLEKYGYCINKRTILFFHCLAFY